MVARAQRAAAGVRDRAQARSAVRDHHADVAAALALDAHAVRGDRGPRSLRKAVMTSSSWRLSIGQPAARSRPARARRSASSPQGGDVLGRGVDGRTNSSTSAKLRSASMPPAVAHAPIVTTRRERARTSRMRSASSAVVIDPSTIDRSYGPSTRRGGLGEVGDLDLAGERQQLVLAVQERQLAAVAGRELPDGEGGLALTAPPPA